MSRENVEKLREVYEAFSRGDFDRFLGYVDPDIVLNPGVTAPDAQTQYVGRQALREFFVRIVAGPWQSVSVEPQRVIDAEDGRVLCVERWRFQGRDGIELERELASLFTFRDGLIWRIDGFTDTAKALEAVGLGD
jgi:ketosteroid isomerase-like protein